MPPDLCGAENRGQSFAPARQALYQLSYVPSCLNISVSMSFLRGLSFGGVVLFCFVFETESHNIAQAGL